MEYVPPFGTTDPDGSYVNGNPATGIQGSIPPAEAFEHPQREIVNVETKSGLVPDSGDLMQLTKAVRSQLLNYASDTGATNAMVATYDPPFLQLTAGTPFRVKALHTTTSTGISLAVDGNAPAPVLRANGSVPDVGDIAAGQIVDLIFDGTNFQISNFAGFTSATTNNNTFVTNIPYVADTSPNANTVVAAFSPAITSLGAGLAIIVKMAHGNTGAVQIVVNANVAKSINGLDGQPLVAGQIVTGMMALLLYDGAAFQLANPAIARPVSGGNIAIAKRAFYQDLVQHTTTVKSPNFVEAFRISYVPALAGNRVLATSTGSYGSGSGNQFNNKRNVNLGFEWSSDNGSTWHVGTQPAIGAPGDFQVNHIVSAWESSQPIITERDEVFSAVGQLTVPVGAPPLLFRITFSCGSSNTSDVKVLAGTTVHVIEYTG